MDRQLPEWMLKSKNIYSNAHEKLPGINIPVLSFEGKIRFIMNFSDCCYVCEGMLLSLGTINQLVIGFDMEWPIHWNKGVNQNKTSLIQMCPNAQVCYVFHVIEWKQLPKIFIELINHHKVRLVGLNIGGDIWKLGRDFDLPILPIITHNLIELSSLANRKLSIKENWSLARLVLYTLKKVLNKSTDLRMSNWSMAGLTAQQLKYAATDAYASLLVYKRLQEIENRISFGSSTSVENAP